MNGYMSSTPQFPSLLGPGQSFVLNLPRKFSLGSQVANASRISLATAFAKLSGWSMISQALQRSSAELCLLTGLDFYLTEPDLLQAWLKLQAERPRTRACLAMPKGRTFHPKVLLVEKGAASFAIVGSGNLSEGGLQTNVECSVYVDDPKAITALKQWVEFICSVQAGTVELRQSDIDAYRPKYKKFASAFASASRSQRQIEKRLANEHAATMADWNGAVRAATRYFASGEFEDDWTNNWRPAIAEIRKLIPAPKFDYSIDDWRGFFSHWQFGHLIPIKREVAFKSAATTKAGLRQLAASGGPTLQALNDILDPGGRFHVPNVGVNLVSKVMAVNRPLEWPVFNGPVANVLKSYGYRPPKGGSRGTKYLEFARLMRKFRDETGARTMLELDPFFYRENLRLGARASKE